MRKLTTVFCIAAALTAWAGKKEASLQSDLAREFERKTFQIKIRLGSFIRDTNLQSGQECNRLIDTEYLSDGTIRYQGRKGCFSSKGNLVGDYFSSNFYAEPARLTRSLNPGSIVMVQKIEIKDDRIEFSLAAEPSSGTISSYAKLKLYPREGVRATLDQLMPFIAQVFVIEKFEKLSALDREYRQLAGRLQTQTARYSNFSGGPNQKIEAARELRGTLQQLVENRRNLAALNGNLPDVNSYTTQIGALDKDINSFQAAAKAERIQNIRAKLSSNQTQRSQLIKNLEHSSTTSNATLQSKIASIEQCQQLLQEEQSLGSQLEQEGEPMQDITSDVTSGRKELDRIAAGLSSDRKRVQLAQLNADYHEMEKRRIRLIGAYTQAAAGAQQQGALQSVLAHLHSMLQNRNEAKALGYEAAGKQISQLEAELKSINPK